MESQETEMLLRILGQESGKVGAWPEKRGSLGKKQESQEGSKSNSEVYAKLKVLS